MGDTMTIDENVPVKQIGQINPVGWLYDTRHTVEFSYCYEDAELWAARDGCVKPLFGADDVERLISERDVALARAEKAEAELAEMLSDQTAFPAHAGMNRRECQLCR